MNGIRTIAQYLDATRRVAATWGYTHTVDQLWLRGHSDANWLLLPGLYRKGAMPQYERELVREFRLRAHSHVDPRPTSDLEWLFVMQHHGAVTRLLDWTEVDLMALYFAVADENNRTDGAVWIFDPWSLNERTLEQRSVPVATDARLRQWILDPTPELMKRRVAAEFPVAVRPPHGTDRIAAQRGMFTLHGWRRTGLDVIPGVRIRKLLIDRSAKRRLKKELHVSGTTSNIVFPDLDGLAEALTYQFSRRYAGTSTARSAKRTQKRPAKKKNWSQSASF
jgi:hypothetical protein